MNKSNTSEQKSYYCKGLLKYNGRKLIPKDLGYTRTHNGIDSNEDNISININVVDSLIWRLAVVAKVRKNNLTSIDNKKEVEERIDDVLAPITEYNALMDITDDDLRYDIIHEVIDYVEISYVEKPNVLQIKPYYKGVIVPSAEKVRYIYTRRGCKVELRVITPEGTSDITDLIEYRPHFYVQYITVS